MGIDISRARLETPGCTNVLHFNNAGSSLMPRPVLDAMITHLELEAHIGGYEAASYAKQSVERFYSAAAQLLNCEASEIAFSDCATHAWNVALYSIPFQAGDRILISRAEYASNYISLLQIAARAGLNIEVIPSDESGQVSISALQNAIDEKVKLIAITHIPSNSGLVNPIAEIGKISREAGILYMIDACQSVGQIPLDVNLIGCDLLSTSGRKYLRGPRGTGFLYVRRDTLERLRPLFLDSSAIKWTTDDTFKIHQLSRRFEHREINVASKIGLAVAIDYALNWGLESIWSRIINLAQLLREKLSESPRVHIQDIGIKQCGIVTFTVENIDLKALLHELLRKRVNLSISGKNSTPLDMQYRNLENVLRASVHYYNTEEEVLEFCQFLSSIISSLA